MLPNLQFDDVVVVDSHILFDSLKVGDIIVFKTYGTNESGQHESIAHRAASLGSILAARKKFETTGVNIFHFEDKIKEAWIVVDGLTAALQVGAVKTISNEAD